jgi:hypothetical protein
MKKLTFGLAALAIGAASLSSGAYALTAAPGLSAPSDYIVQVKTKKHKKTHKKSKATDENKDTSAPPETPTGDKKAM